MYRFESVNSNPQGLLGYCLLPPRTPHILSFIKNTKNTTTSPLGPARVVRPPQLAGSTVDPPPTCPVKSPEEGFDYMNNKSEGLWARLLVLVTALVPAAGSHAASFDCSKATAPVEQAICKSKTLSALDVENAQLYARIVDRGVNPREYMTADQRQWLAEDRNRCKHAQCLALTIWQRSAMFRSTLERSGEKTDDIPEVATNAQDLGKLVAASASAQTPTAQAASKDTAAASAAAAQAAPAARPAASPTSPVSPGGPRLSSAAPAEGLARANAAQQQREAQQARDADPVPRLQAALGQFRSIQCAEIYTREVRSTLRDIEGIRADAARFSPQARQDPHSSSEMLVSQHAETLLRAIRANGCL
jgi:uncharacterized protein